MGAIAFKTKSANQLLSYNKCKLISSVRKINVWTPDNTVKSPHKNVDIPNRSLPEHMWENLEKWADKTAIECGITKQSYTFHQIYKYSRNFGTKLRTQFKINDGDVICIMIPNCPDYQILVLGALEAGAVVSTINPIYTSYEVERLITFSDAKLLIGVPETIAILKHATILAKRNLPIITVKGTNNTIPSETICFEELAIVDNVDHSILNKTSKAPDKVAFLPYSSGTTGLPKGVELTHRNIVANSLQQNAIKFYGETTKTNQDTTLAVMPFYHSYGLFMVLQHKLSLGIKLVTVPKFHPNTFINMLKENTINFIHLAPPMILFLGSYPEVTKDLLKSINTIMSGGSTFAMNDVSKLLEKMKPGAYFLNAYGLTETSPLVTTILPGSTSYDNVGFAVPNSELRVVDSNLNPLGPNEVGELLIRGPHVMKGYKNNYEANNITLTEDGWLRSGDLASIDKDGTVKIVSRLKELIKVKGFQVPPAELENIIKSHPYVHDAAVVGIPHARMGEIPKAFVVLEDGRLLSAVEIMSFVNKRVAEYKRIKEVQFVDSLPRNPSGKVLRRVLAKSS